MFSYKQAIVPILDKSHYSFKPETCMKEVINQAERISAVSLFKRRKSTRPVEWIGGAKRLIFCRLEMTENYCFSL